MNLQSMKRSEDTEQIRLMKWAEAAQEIYPELRWLHHIPNGGRRNRQEAIKLRNMGVKAGVADLHLPYPRGAYHSLYVEMKYDRNTLTPEQREFLSAMQIEGHKCIVCHSAEAAIESIRHYLGLYAGKVFGLDVIVGHEGKNDAYGIHHIY